MKKIFSLLMMLMAVMAVAAQENTVNRIPSRGYDPNQQQYTTYNRGFWFAAEAGVGMSAKFHGHNIGLSEADLTLGYRFSQYLRFGVGVGARYYFADNDQKLRRNGDIDWALPVFATIRGNLMPGIYRSVVPYYGLEAGMVVRDGFMFRPTIGARFGEGRESFTLGLSYMGQELASWECAADGSCKKGTHFTNFIMLRLGYEF